MTSLPSALIAPFLRATRANATFITAEGARRRVRERELRPQAYGPPRRLRRDVRVDVDHRGGWPVYRVTPSAPTPVGTVIYAHGGGWVNEIAPQHWQLAAQIAAQASTTVLLPIYPLVPFGTARQAQSGVVQMAMDAAERGPVCLAGDSAGGQIALSATLALRDAGAPVAAAVLISPALDLTWSNPRIPEVQPTDPWLGTPGGRVLADLWRGEDDLTDPVVSPLFGDFGGAPPLTVFTGTRDVLNPDVHLLAQKARAAGAQIAVIEAAGQLHVYPLLPTALGASTRAAIALTLSNALRSH